MVDICVGYADKAVLHPMVSLNKVLYRFTLLSLYAERFAKLQKATVSFVI